MKFDPFDSVLSNKSKKNKANADLKPYFENTSDNLGLYKNPSLKSEEEEGEEEEDRPKGKALLKRIYGGATACWKGYEQFGMKEKDGRQVPNCIPVRSKSIKREPKGVGFTPADKVGKTDPLYKVSNPKEVQRKAKSIYGKDAVVYKSSKPTKKYQIMNKDGKWVHFGDAKMEDFTKHLDPVRRKSYLSRALGIKGKWEQDIYSPNYLSVLLLW